MKFVRALLPLIVAAVVATIVGGVTPGYFCHMLERQVDACCCPHARGTPGNHKPGLRAEDCCERVSVAPGANLSRGTQATNDVPSAAPATVLGEPEYAFEIAGRLNVVPEQSRGPPPTQSLFVLNCSWLS
jgi:hypothetical protein